MPDTSAIEKDSMMISPNATVYYDQVDYTETPADPIRITDPTPDSRNAGSQYITQRKYTPLDLQKEWDRVSGDVDWLFPPILEAGTVNALFGKPGVGKSLVTLYIAVTLIRHRKKVMYIDDENRKVDIIKRLKSFGCDKNELDNLIIYSFAGLPPLDTDRGGADLLALAEEHKPDLVVLDTTTRMVRGKENDSDTFLQLYRCSLVPLKSRGITVLRLDHPGKEEAKGQRGSSAKDGDVDTVWKITGNAKTGFLLVRTKSRAGEGDPCIKVKVHGSPETCDYYLEWQSQAEAPDESEDKTILVKSGVTADMSVEKAGCLVRAANYRMGQERIRVALNELRADEAD